MELYHGLSNELPLNISKSGIPSVVTMHDVIYRRLPQCYKPIDRIIYDYKYGASCRNATRIIAVSQRTKLDVMEYYGIPEEKIDVVYQGCDDIFLTQASKEQIATTLKKYGVATPYIIQVGSIEERKNAMLSVRALSALSDRPGLPADLKLVLVGRRTAYLDKVMTEAEKLGVTGRVQVLDNVMFKDLPALYQGALTAIYPSRYEGFGIPVLEALNSRIPCIAATGSCLEEAGGAEGLYIDSDNARELAEAITLVNTDLTVRNRIIEAGVRHASRFSNADIPERLMKVYRQAIEEYAGGM